MADPDREQAQTEADNEDEAPSVGIPSHAPLPPPPEVTYTRPALGQHPSVNASSSPGGAGPADSGGYSDAASHGAALSAGLSFVASIIAGALIGMWIDAKWIHASVPWATLVMLVLGTVAGFLNLQRLLARINRNKK